MSKSTYNQSTTTASHPTSSVPEWVRRQRALVYQTFQNLDNKWENYALGNKSYNIVSLDSNQENWIGVLN
ncbi:hypothetical protein PCASD_09614 [Puccinia coronata f. sp. avenae]|uniref:Uncharacterized protein n=1 Tax=Puccinia coronata f. sp. avenae TaxID=200324 RepID=A0A2N5T201_9BASI|nr:hypothetical protein PCASD_18945 [Puccinia coronata f. sp. avenae]PLW39749.1 hypothetical protein PCASD_09614 [Puccinia coronata f. sp. avenae]